MLRIVACLALVVGIAVAVAGCALLPGGSQASAGARAAVSAWAAALSQGNADSLSQIYDPSYSYDGAGQPPTVDQDIVAEPSLSRRVEIISVDVHDGRATARVRVIVHGMLPWYAAVPEIRPGEDVSWAGEGPPPEEPVAAPPELFPAPHTDEPPPAPEEPGERPPPPAAGEQPRSEQLDLVPFTLSAIYVLELAARGGTWLIVAQREEELVALVGENAVAPVFEQVRVNGGSSEPVSAGAAVAIEGRVANFAGEAVLARIGSRCALLEASGGAFVGEIPAPALAGRYLLRLSAGNVNRASRSAGFSRVSREVVVAGGLEPGVQFELGEGVSADEGLVAAVERWLRLRGEPERLAELYDPDYRYDGMGRMEAAWRFAALGRCETHATLAAASPLPEGWRVTLELTEQCAGAWLDVRPLPAPEPGPVPAGRELVGGEWAHRLVLVSDYSRRGEAWLIVAQRAAQEAWYRLGEQPPAVTELQANGSPAPEVAPRAVLHVSGAVSPREGAVVLSLGERTVRVEASSGSFAREIRAPYRPGRYVLVARLVADAPAAQALPSAAASIEVAVRPSADVPPVDVTVAPGVQATRAQLRLARRWLAAAVCPVRERLRAALYSESFSLDGLRYEEIVRRPRLAIYGEPEGEAQIVRAAQLARASLVQLHIDLRGEVYVAGLSGEGGERAPRPLQTEGPGAAPGAEPPVLLRRVCGDVVLEAVPEGDGLAIVGEYFPAIAQTFAQEPPLELAALAVRPRTVAPGARVRVAGSAPGAAEGVLRLGRAAQRLRLAQGQFAGVLAAPQRPGRYLVHVVLRGELGERCLLAQRVVRVVAEGEQG